MKFLRRFLTRLFNSATGRAHEERLSEEIAEHITLQTEENLRAGLSPVEARRQAMLKFGGVEALKLDYRTARGLRMPALATVIIVSLASGIGVNTTIYFASQSCSTAISFFPGSCGPLESRRRNQC
jgi:hypothetical protein